MSQSEGFVAPRAVTHRPVEVAHLLNNLKWRYAVKKFDPAKKIDPKIWSALEHATIHAPSSFGLQPWRFIEVSDPALRRKLRGASWDQSQITDASHLLVFARRTKVSHAEVDAYVESISGIRGVSKESLNEYRAMMLGFAQKPGLDAGAWAGKQVYIALGVFLTSAAMLGVDTCPMEGFDPAQYDEILGLPAQNLAATVVATAGYRAADDHHSSLKKVRFHEKDVIIRR